MLTVLALVCPFSGKRPLVFLGAFTLPTSHPWGWVWFTPSLIQGVKPEHHTHHWPLRLFQGGTNDPVRANQRYFRGTLLNLKEGSSYFYLVSEDVSRQPFERTKDSFQVSPSCTSVHGELMSSLCIPSLANNVLLPLLLHRAPSTPAGPAHAWEALPLEGLSHGFLSNPSLSGRSLAPSCICAPHYPGGVSFRHRALVVEKATVRSLCRCQGYQNL